MQQYLKDNYRTATLEEAAAKVSLSPAYLSRVFKEKSGTSFSELLLKTRMEKHVRCWRISTIKAMILPIMSGTITPKLLPCVQSVLWAEPIGIPQIPPGWCRAMKGMKRKFFLKRMWNFVVVMLIPALLLVAVTTYMTLVTQMHRMTQDNERGIEAVRSNISLVLDSVLAQNSYMTGMTRTNMVLNKALKRESLAYTDAIYLRSLVSSLNSMTNAYDYVDSVLIYMDGYDRALTSSGLVNLSADDYSGWYSVYSSMSDTERTCIAPVVVNAGKASERRQLVVCARMLTMEGCVAVTLNISHLQEIIAVLRPSDNQHLYLVDGSGRLLAKAGDAGANGRAAKPGWAKRLSGAGNTAEQEHESGSSWMTGTAC